MEEKIEGFLRVGKDAAKKAGRVALEILERGIVIEKKEDGSSVTNADIDCEKMVVDSILSYYPKHQIHGEEFGLWNKDGESEYLWAVDPIDGTSSYLSHESNFCVNISLLKNKMPLLGIIYNPITDEMFTTAEAKASEMNGRKLPLIKKNEFKEGTLNMQFPVPKEKDMNILISLWADKYFKKILDLSGSPVYNLALVAKGAHDHFVMYCSRDPNIWDYSAGVLLVRNSGGIVTNLEGKDVDPLTHKRYMIASSNKIVHERLLGLLKEYDFGSSEKKKEKMILIGGFYGTGKSSLAMKLAEKLGYQRFNSDISRRDFKLEKYELKDSDVVWGTIHLKAALALQEGKGVIIESTYLDDWQRHFEYNIALNNNADVILIEVICPEEIAKKRISERAVSPDGFHVPTNRVEYYDKKKDLWEPVIYGLNKFNRKHISYLIYDSVKNELYEGFLRKEHRKFAEDIANSLELELLKASEKIVNAKKRYAIK